MSLRLLLRQFLLPILLPISIASLAYLYLYPIFHGSACVFPLPTYTTSQPTTSPFLHTLLDHLSTTDSNNNSNKTKAPFRLLILADPQLEGDTSLPPSSSSLLPKLSRHYTDLLRGPSKYTSRGRRERNYPSLIWNTLLTVLGEDVPLAFSAGRKRLDLWGNDYYLGHIYRTLRWWAGGTHVVVLGDLVGSQWVEDGEFEERGRRFWGRVFAGGERVGDGVTGTGGEGWDGGEVREEVLGEDKGWEGRVINVAGNHDVGYAGDISRRRMERFERVFGRANWDLRFRYPVVFEEEGEASTATSTVPSLHMVVLNDLALDTPALDQSVQDETYRFMNHLIESRLPSVEESNTFTLLLTHVPLHKRGGICPDAPYFGYHEADDQDFEEGEGPRFRAGGLREQNHLSSYISEKGILEGVFGMSGEEGAVRGAKGRNGLILTGHDHAGCDVVHFLDRPDNSPSSEDGDDEEDTKKGENPWSWDAKRYDQMHLPLSSEPNPSIREVTLRSMMGEYGGNAGFLSVWYDPDPSVQGWKYEISTCMFGVQHVWWGVHVLGIVSGLLFLLWVGLEVGGRVCANESREGKERLRVKKRQ